MLPGFPKTIVREKVSSVQYVLKRDDGYTVIVIRGINGWWFGGTGKKVKSLSVAEFDMKNGYTSYDQLNYENDT